MIVRGVVSGQKPGLSFYTENSAQFPIRGDAKGKRLASLVGREIEIEGDFKRLHGKPVFCVSHYEVIDDIEDWTEAWDKEWEEDEIEFRETPGHHFLY